MNHTVPDNAKVRRLTQDGRVTSALTHYSPVAAVIGAVLVRCFIWLNADVSWLLTLGEQVLAGGRAYVDFSEPNPPASILLYMPAIVLAQLLGVAAEAIVNILIFAGVFVSLMLVGRILPKDALLPERYQPLLFALAVVLLLILPGDNFAERENIALIAALPMLAVYAARLEGKNVEPLLAGLAGIGSGIVIAIKPHFALALALPFAYVTWCAWQQGRRLAAVVLSPEHLAMLLLVACYGVVLVWGFPQYLDQAFPLVLTLYVPLRYSLPYMLSNASVILVTVTALAALGLGRRELHSPLVRVVGLAVLGFAAVFIIQGKGWPYHGYPAVALALLLLSFLLLRRLSRAASEVRPRLDFFLGLALWLAIYALAQVWLLQEPDRSRLVNEVSRFLPPRPKIVSICGAPGLAFPLTRKLHGAPIGRTPFQWISAYTDRMLIAGTLDPGGGRKISDPALRRIIADYARRDRSELADTIRTRHPDVILIDGYRERRWALLHPELAAALQPFRLAETFEGVEIWLPRRQPKMNASAAKP